MIKKLTFLLFIFTVEFLFAQHIPLDLSKYPFIKHKENILEIPESGDSTLINNFFVKLDSLYRTKQGKINIVHIGGSHVQAGFFSNKLRENFNFFNDTLTLSAGIIFPFKIAKTNNPHHYSVDYKGDWTTTRSVLRKNFTFPLGVTGIAVETSDSLAEISVRFLADSLGGECLFDTLVLLGKSIDEGRVEPILRISDTTFISAVYNSIQGTYTFALPQLTDNFSVYFKQNDSIPHAFVLNGFIPKNGSQGIVYHAIGINGSAVPSYLSCENFERELALIKPDLMIFGIGINDAVNINFNPDIFINNYNFLLEKIRRVSPDCAFVFVTNNDSFRRVRRNTYAVNNNGLKVEKAFYKIALQNNGAVWNQFGIMGGLSSMRKWQNASLAPVDKIHFTKNGYELLADMLFNALMEYRENITNY